MKFDELVKNHVGEFGTHQKIQFFFVCLPTIITAMHALSWTFTAAFSHHRCRTEQEIMELSSPEYLNPLFQGNQLQLTEDGVYKQCFYNDTVAACPYGYVHDHSQMTYSAIHRWDIVCDRTILKATIQSSYYVGQMLGSLVFGYLGDRIGRKKVFFIAIIIQILSGIGMAIVPHWSLFMLLRACVGFSHPGIFVIAVVIGMELVGPSKRKIAAIVPGICFAFGQVLLGTLAFFVRDYRTFQAIFAAPAIFFITYWWFIPESSRWLISQKRYQEADKILRSAAKANHKQLPDDWWNILEDVGEMEPGGKGRVRRYNFLDMFKTPKLRKISLTILFCWPIVSMVYYGMAMKTDFLGGDIYTTFIFGALVEIPAVIAVYALLDKLGRKRLLTGGFFMAALCLLSNMVITGNHWAISMGQFLFGKASITLTYATIYTFTPELFPTVIRNMAFGVCSMMARTGAIIASYVVMFLVEIYGKTIIVIPFSLLSILAGVISWFVLPETMGHDLPETIEEVEGKEKSSHEMEPLQGIGSKDKENLDLISKDS